MARLLVSLGLATLALSDKTQEFKECVARWNDLQNPPPDGILGLKELIKKEPDLTKVIDLSVGAYRTSEGEPWVLPSVVEARKRLLESKLRHEYLPIDGLPEFTSSAEKLLYGPSLDGTSAVTIQALSGTGAVRLTLEFMNRYGPKTIYVPATTWPNHFNIARDAGYVGDRLRKYPYVDSTGRGLDWAGLVAELGSAPPGSIVLLHLCAHNPSGIDPTPAQWEELADLVEKRNLLPLFDSAYLGFASGDLDRDADPFRLFVRRGLAPWACVSFSKNFGLYSERVGAVHATVESADAAAAVRGNLKQIARAMYSNPPAFGARIVATVLQDAKLHADWLESLKVMSSRINDMRLALRSKLEANGAPGTWEHITSQIGMFSFTGIPAEVVIKLREKHHIYMLTNGRISMAGINPNNVDRLADGISATLKASGPR